jgi:pimeloyl-ACP methyl ester carboxylesterase
MGAIRLMQRQKPGVLLTDFNACNNYTGGFDAADALQCPVLFVSGAQDMMTPPRAAQALRERIAANPACSEPMSVVLQPCGHQIMGEQPDRLLQAIKQFMTA